MKDLHYIEATVEYEGEVIGTVSIGFALGAVYRPSHTHFVCPCCGLVWGKVLLPPGKKARHFPVTATCREHGGGVFSSRLNDVAIDRFSLTWSVGVMAHDFLVMYDWVGGLVKPENYAVSASEEDWTVPIKSGDKKICQ